MHKYNTVWIFRQVRRVFPAVAWLSAVLPLSAAELAHRWCFNGDYSDSVGGVDAVKCGTYVSLYGGRVQDRKSVV